MTWQRARQSLSVIMRKTIVAETTPRLTTKGCLSIGYIACLARDSLVSRLSPRDGRIRWGLIRLGAEPAGQMLSTFTKHTTCQQ